MNKREDRDDLCVCMKSGCVGGHIVYGGTAMSARQTDDSEQRSSVEEVSIQMHQLRGVSRTPCMLVKLVS